MKLKFLGNYKFNYLTIILTTTLVNLKNIMKKESV